MTILESFNKVKFCQGGPYGSRANNEFAISKIQNSRNQNSDQDF